MRQPGPGIGFIWISQVVYFPVERGLSLYNNKPFRIS